MKKVKFSDVTIYTTRLFYISFFKKKKRKITKSEYDNYSYIKAKNFGLFYIGISRKSFDISSNLGLIRLGLPYESK